MGSTSREHGRPWRQTHPLAAASGDRSGSKLWAGWRQVPERAAGDRAATCCATWRPRVVVNKRRRNAMKDLIRVIEQESYEYSDPITQFLECLFVR